MKKFLKNYWFILCMLTGIVGGCLVGAFAPAFGGKIKFLGTLFINMMFCVVVPMVFCSIASAIANMKSVKRAGKIMGVTVATFLVTAAIAGVLMYIVCRIFPLVDGQYTIVEGEVGEALGFGDMIVNFFTKPDFMELLSRKAILPLIVAAVLFGFGVQMNGGPETRTAQFLEDVTGCIMKTVKLITYYAPIGFFGFFADLVATYGPELMKDYSRTLIIYYVMSFAYMFIFFPIYARFGGGKGGAKIMFSKLSARRRCPSAPARLWPASPPTWRWRRRPASARMSARSYCPWAPPCTWTARPCPPSSRWHSCSECSAWISPRIRPSWPSSWRCSPLWP